MELIESFVRSSGFVMGSKLVGEGFYKKYGRDKFIFKNANFKMEGGHIYGLVAPNGFGKTTLMKCIAGISKFTGKVKYNEVGIGSHFNGQIVHSPSTSPFDDFPLKVIDYFRSLMFLKGIQLKDALKKFKESYSFRLKNSRCRELSTGQKKLFQLFLDFLSDPEVILLDEPLNGLDHEARSLVTSNLSLLAEQGKIILISTHILSDIDNLTDKVFIIKDGLLNFYEGRKISEAYSEAFSSFMNKGKEEGVVKF